MVHAQGGILFCLLFRDEITYVLSVWFFIGETGSRKFSPKRLVSNPTSVIHRSSQLQSIFILTYTGLWFHKH